MKLEQLKRVSIYVLGVVLVCILVYILVRIIIRKKVTDKIELEQGNWSR